MSFHDNIRRLREERAQLATKMREMVAESAGNMEPDKRKTFDELDKRQESLREQIETLRKQDELDTNLAEFKDTELRREHHANAKTADESKLTWQEKDLALRAAFLGGRASREMKRAAEKAGLDWHGTDFRFRRPRLSHAPRSVAEARAMIVESRAATNALNKGTSDEGADTVANNLMAAMEMWLVAFGGVRSVATIIRRDSGATLPIPVMNDTSTSNMGAILAENTATTNHTPTFGQVTMSAKKYTSRLVPASIEFLQDTSIDAASVIGEALGVRIGRIQNQHFTIGPSSDGTPLGLVDPSTNSSLVGVTASTFGAPVYADLVTLLHSVDAAYRGGPNDVLMFSDNTLGLLKKMVDSQNRPLWLPSMRDGDPDTIFGKRYVVNYAMNNFSTTTGGLKVMTYGDHSKYWIMDVMDVDVRVLRERYAELGQVAWLAFSRADGYLINRNAVKHYLTGST